MTNNAISVISHKKKNRILKNAVSLGFIEHISKGIVENLDVTRALVGKSSEKSKREVALSSHSRKEPEGEHRRA